jgi:Mn-dependent DtxR family transcriptional regulator
MKKGNINGTKKSAINRINMKETIFKAIEESGKPISTAEIAEKLNKSWHTVIRYCLDLENEEKLTKLEVGRINIWQVKK